MSLALRRAKLLDTFVIAGLLIILSAVHYALLQSKRSHRFTEIKLEAVYRALLISSWPIFAVGAIPLVTFWFKGRSADRAHFSTASKSQLAIVMACTALVTVGCILLAIAEIVWVSDFGFRRFHAVVLLAIISVMLLIWIAVQVALVIREAYAVRKSLSEAPNHQRPHHGFPPGPSDFENQAHSEDDKDMPFS